MKYFLLILGFYIFLISCSEEKPKKKFSPIKNSQIDLYIPEPAYTENIDEEKILPPVQKALSLVYIKSQETHIKQYEKAFLSGSPSVEDDLYTKFLTQVDSLSQNSFSLVGTSLKNSAQNISSFKGIITQATGLKKASTSLLNVKKISSGSNSLEIDNKTIKISEKPIKVNEKKVAELKEQIKSEYGNNKGFAFIHDPLKPGEGWFFTWDKKSSVKSGNNSIKTIIIEKTEEIGNLLADHIHQSSGDIADIIIAIEESTLKNLELSKLKIRLTKEIPNFDINRIKFIEL